MKKGRDYGNLVLCVLQDDYESTVFIDGKKKTRMNCSFKAKSCSKYIVAKSRHLTKVGQDAESASVRKLMLFTGDPCLGDGTKV